MHKLIPIRHIHESLLNIDGNIFKIPGLTLYFVKHGFLIKYEQGKKVVIKGDLIFELTFIDPRTKIKEEILSSLVKKPALHDYDYIFSDINENNTVILKNNEIYVDLKYKNQIFKFKISLTRFGYAKINEMIKILELMN
jgi:hypothetical protein